MASEVVARSWSGEGWRDGQESGVEGVGARVRQGSEVSEHEVVLAVAGRGGEWELLVRLRMRR